LMYGVRRSRNTINFQYLLLKDMIKESTSKRLLFRHSKKHYLNGIMPKKEKKKKTASTDCTNDRISTFPKLSHHRSFAKIRCTKVEKHFAAAT
jgi:hypothetical protein